MARRTSSISIFAAILAALLALWAPAALAHHKKDHAQGGGKPASSSQPKGEPDGDADSDSNTAHTEDNDSDGLDNEGKNASGSGSYPNRSHHPSGKDKYVENGGSGNQGKSESDPDDDGRGPERCEPLSSRNSGDGTCGPDKPNGTGGTDIYDQDGNNGCGNDQDFDDDNEGWCGKPTKVKAKNVHVCDADAAMAGVQKCDEIKGEAIARTPTKPCDADATMPGIQKCEKPDVVEGINVAQPVEEEVELETQPSAPTVDSVLGLRVNAAAQPAAVAPAAVAPAAVAKAAPAAQGGVLPFTGSSDLLPLVAVALMLIATGALTLRGRLSSK